jgi:hypothetical protein
MHWEQTAVQRDCGNDAAIAQRLAAEMAALLKRWKFFSQLQAWRDRRPTWWSLPAAGARLLTGVAAAERHWPLEKVAADVAAQRPVQAPHLRRIVRPVLWKGDFHRDARMRRLPRLLRRQGRVASGAVAAAGARRHGTGGRRRCGLGLNVSATLPGPKIHRLQPAM